MRFRILGPLEVYDDGGRMASVGGPQQRALLAALLLHANRVVSVDRLVAYLWGEDPPATARGLLQGCVALLRRVLRFESDGVAVQPLRTRPPGYLLEVCAGELDLHRFDELSNEAVASAAEVGGLARASALLVEALALWRGRPLDGVTLEGAEGEVAGLEERRLGAIELKIDVDLALGRRNGIVAELRTHVREHRLRERFWAQLMLALYDDQRQAEALATFHEVRAILDEELGVEPGDAVGRLHRAVLSGPDAVAAYRRAHPVGTRSAWPATMIEPAIASA